MRSVVRPKRTFVHFIWVQVESENARRERRRRRRAGAAWQHDRGRDTYPRGLTAEATHGIPWRSRWTSK